MTPPAITRPAELELPGAAEMQDLLTKFLTHSDVTVFSTGLTQAGREVFARELVESIVAAQAADNLQPVQDTIEGWYRTYLFLREPGFEIDRKRVQTDEETLEPQQIRKCLDLV